MIAISTMTLLRYIGSCKTQSHYQVCKNLVVAYDKLFAFHKDYVDQRYIVELAIRAASIKMVDNILESVFEKENH